MRHAFTIKTILILMLFAAIAPANAAKSGMAPGSFLKKPAATVKMLSDQVTSDKTVMTRYAKHFRTSPEMLARFFFRRFKDCKAFKAPQSTSIFYCKRRLN